MYPIKNIQSKITYTAKKSLCCLLISIALSSTTHAIILYSGDNNANLTAPDTAQEAVFNSVAKISNADGSDIVGSAVHIQGKYLLTAEHVLYRDVTPRRTNITFDGITYWEIDLNFLPIQISTADLVLFKLIQNPNLPSASLYSSTNERFRTGTLIGWGKGRDSNQVNQTGITRNWIWGDGSNIVKRWGTNRIENTGNTSIYGKTYNYMRTQLDSTPSNPTEAAFAYYDSGSGIFVSNSGTWQLAGITTAVSTTDSSRFSSSSPDSNYFVRISQYRQTILSNIPDISTYSGWAIDQSLYGSDAEATADPDQDGLDNQTEFNLGTNPNNADTSNDGLSDKDLVDYGLDPNVDHTLLYGAIVQSIADLRAGATIIEVINNQATITLKLESSNDLESWSETGDNATLQVSTSNNTQFYRFKLID